MLKFLKSLLPKPDPNSPSQLFELFVRGDHAELLRRCREVAAAGAARPPHYHLMGTALMARGELNEAVEALREALRLDPAFLDAQVHLAECFRLKNVGYQAIEEYRKALAIEPNMPAVYWRLGEMYLEQKAFAKAAESYAGFLKLSPGQPDGLYNLAITRFLSGERQAALETREQLRAVKPELAAKLERLLEA